jgi:hypothetical protein
LSFRAYSGVVYTNGTDFTLTFVEGEDYANDTISWSSVEVPADDVAFEDLTPQQQYYVLSQTGYSEHTNKFYFKADAQGEEKLLTSFVEGVDYQNVHR